MTDSFWSGLTLEEKTDQLRKTMYHFQSVADDRATELMIKLNRLEQEITTLKREVQEIKNPQLRIDAQRAADQADSVLGEGGFQIRVR